MIDRPRGAQRWRHRIARVLSLAAIVGVTMLGNLRLQASETVPTGQPSFEPTAAMPRMPVGWMAGSAGAASSPTAVRKQALDPLTASMVDVDDGVGTADEIELVPAIYAWNPDVRFVYFRHVSKWM